MSICDSTEMLWGVIGVCVAICNGCGLYRTASRHQFRGTKLGWYPHVQTVS